jgi:hypothetical protein
VSLTDVDINIPADGNALMYDDVTGNWINKNVDLDEIGQLAIVGPVSGQVLKYNGANWANADDEGGLLPKITVYGTEAGYRLGKGGQFIVMTSLGSETFVANVPEYGQWDIYDGTAATVYGSVEVDTVKEYSIDLRHQIPEGSTVVPTDVIQTWLYCAGIFDKNYTNISQVLADSTTLSALIASNNAVDYMARSTTWASAICADSTAMSYIGLNNYCSNTLLGVNDWLTSICSSAYFESVLNVKVPTMTSNTTPKGEAYASQEYDSNYLAYKVFDNNNSTSWYANANASTNQYVGYDFENAVLVEKVLVRPNVASNQSRLKNIKIEYSDDKSTWSGSNAYVIPNADQDNIYVLSDTGSHRYWRMFVVDNYTSYNIGCATLQFYGREDV